MAEGGSDDWRREALAVLVKDVRSELRTRSALAAILMFAVTSIVLVSFTVPTEGFGLTFSRLPNGDVVVGDTKERAELLSTLFWVVLYFSAMAGLPRVFVKEEEMRTAPALRLAARPAAVFAGKLVFNVAMLLAVTAVQLVLFTFFLRPAVKSWPVLLGVLSVGTVAIAGAATLLGAITSRAGNRGYLMVVLGFGPLLPILVLAINGTAAALHGSGGNNLVGLVSYLVVMTFVSTLLFERVWSD